MVIFLLSFLLPTGFNTQIMPEFIDVLSLIFQQRRCVHADFLDVLLLHENGVLGNTYLTLQAVALPNPPRQKIYAKSSKSVPKKLSMIQRHSPLASFCKT